MASFVVVTGGTRLGIRMARPKFFAVNGATAFSMAPSRRCRCQSSGVRMVMRAVTFKLADRRGGGGVGLPRRLVDHGASEVGDACKAALGTPFLQPVENGDHPRRIAEDQVA